jgi:hypothetical protein
MKKPARHPRAAICLMKSVERAAATLPAESEVEKPKGRPASRSAAMAASAAS